MNTKRTCLLFLLVKYNKRDDIIAKNGQKFKERNAQEKYEIIKPILNYEVSYGEISKKYNISKGLLQENILNQKKNNWNMKI